MECAVIGRDPAGKGKRTEQLAFLPGTTAARRLECGERGKERSARELHSSVDRHSERFLPLN